VPLNFEGTTEERAEALDEYRIEQTRSGPCTCAGCFTSL
jgi:hypothetical protein